MRAPELRFRRRCLTARRRVAQDDTYTESYISTIGVDFVRTPHLASQRHATRRSLLPLSGRSGGVGASAEAARTRRPSLSV